MTASENQTPSRYQWTFKGVTIEVDETFALGQIRKAGHAR
jgi:hypothetical protein